MKTLTFTLLALLATSTGFSQVEIGGKFGINGSRYTTDPKTGKSAARIGYQFGVDSRFGNKVYFSPDFLWNRSTSKLIPVDSIRFENFKSDVKVNSFKVPFTLGYKVVDLKNFNLRMETGGFTNFRYKVKTNTPGLQSTDFNPVNAGMRFGAGMDVWHFTFDFYYDLGLTDVFNNGSNAKYRGMGVDAGLIFKL